MVYYPSSILWAVIKRSINLYSYSVQSIRQPLLLLYLHLCIILLLPCYHLVPFDNRPRPRPQDRQRRAVKLKLHGNAMFKAERYAYANMYYTAALNTMPSSAQYLGQRAVFHSNRAAVFAKTVSHLYASL